MSLLTLKDIGKIYVSEGNVAVGIRGVNLSFERGEFVAVTGKSGSGKSTLLNVISGMDSYEEGELYIEGQSTSHYLQPEWEDYREKYISFIFQDYNIIESFTVLQNVELALMHIEDKKERRRRAMELLDRVGLSSHVKQKGSRLSGGQKQRTVIARALAKDSPIILADEPTGNLDSTTSAEIIELLREVSVDKLLIVVTHNFEQVEKCATRHIRIFDGAVESDHVIEQPERNESSAQSEPKQQSRKKVSNQVKNGLTLGRSIFTAKPKLSFFLCFLMIIGTVGIFLITTVCGEASVLFEDSYIFNHIDGRMVITKQNGEVITEEELEKLVKDTNATGSLHYDILLDQSYSTYATYIHDGMYRSVNFYATYDEDYGDNIIGRYPEADNEVLLYLPISYQPYFGKEAIMTDTVVYMNMSLSVVGVKYYYDNNIEPRCLFTNGGYRIATAVHYLLNSNLRGTVEITNSKNQSLYKSEFYSVIPSFSIEKGKIYVNSSDYMSYYDGKQNTSSLSSRLDFVATYYNYNYDFNSSSQSMTFTKIYDNSYFTLENPGLINNDIMYYDSNYIVISAELLRELTEEFLELSYRQASLFYPDDEAAHAAVEALKAEGYLAVPSDTTYVPDALTTIMTLLSGLGLAIVWIISIIFLAFFINLCSSRTLVAFKGEMAIMRSMGIPVKVIQIGMYVRMLIALIPAYILVILTAGLIYTTPKFNEHFTYLYAWQYALIFLGMLLLTTRITYKQIRKLFAETVKKSLKGGAAE